MRTTTAGGGALPVHVDDAVRLDGVQRSYRRGDQTVPALAGVDVGFARGTFTAVMGPSGSGKSTLLHCAAGLDAPTSGTVLLDGTDIGRMTDRELTRFRRTRVGFVFQSFNLLPALTVAQNVTLPREMAGALPDDPAELDAVLTRVGLDRRRDHRPAELSGGQQQRAAIARALFTKPAVVFADEPTGALDTRTARSVLSLFADSVHTQGQTVVMVTHDPVAASYADRIIFLTDGAVATERGPSTASDVAETLTRLGEPAPGVRSASGNGSPRRCPAAAQPPAAPSPSGADTAAPSGVGIAAGPAGARAASGRHRGPGATVDDRPDGSDRPAPSGAGRPGPSDTGSARPVAAPDADARGASAWLGTVRRCGRVFPRLLAGVGIGLLALPTLVLLLATLALVPVGIGVPVFPWTVRVVRAVAGLGRRHVAWSTGRAVTVPYQAPERHVWRRFAQIVGEPATWRDALWVLASATVGLLVCLLPIMLVVQGGFGLLMPFLWPLLVADGGPWWYLALPVEGTGTALAAAALGILLLAAAPVVAVRADRLVARSARGLLAPTARSLLSTRVRELTVSRADAVEESASSLRRIERDLHDGAQARLVALGMKLSTMETVLDGDPARAREVLDDVRAESDSALQELQDLVRGIHPPVLADRGLGDAVRALALASPLTVETDIALDGRPDPSTETALYFAVSELLTNAAKHGGGRSARVSVRRRADTLVVDVVDDGRGSADPSRGTGLVGVARRLATLDGTMRVTSPPGGPTSITLEVPWT